MGSKVAVVTGSNKGIGFAILKGLCEKFQGTVYLTARDTKRGEDAVQKLKELGHSPSFHQLDITDNKSIETFRDYLGARYGGLDLLVNNAAIAFKMDATESFSEQAEATVQVNYFSTLKLCEYLFPLLRSHARVVNVSSSAGHLSRIPSAELRAKFAAPTLTIPELNELMTSFVRSAKENSNEKDGWGTSAYVVSKVGLSALTVIHQREFEKEHPSRDIEINCVHPGYVDTDMTSHKGPLTIEQGASAPLYLSLQDHGLRGKYVWYDSTVVDWYGSGTPSRA